MRGAAYLVGRRRRAHAHRRRLGQRRRVRSQRGRGGTVRVGRDRDGDLGARAERM